MNISQYPLQKLMSATFLFLISIIKQFYKITYKPRFLLLIILIPIHQ